MSHSYFDAVKNLWIQGQYGTDRASAYLIKKQKLLGLSGDVALEADTIVSTLEEGLEYISEIAEQGKVSEFAIKELREFCIIKNCEDDIQTILDAFERGVTPKSNDPARTLLPVQYLEISDCHVVAEQSLPDVVETCTPQMDKKSKVNSFWPKYYALTSISLKKIFKSIDKANTAEELMQLDIPLVCEQFLSKLEGMISASLVSQGDYTDIRPVFSSISDDFLNKNKMFASALKSTVMQKRLDTELFASINRVGRSRQYGVGSLFSAIGQNTEKRKFASILDEQIWLSFESALVTMQDWLAEIVISYYDMYAIRTGGDDFNTMHQAHSESDYILRNLESVQENQRVDVLWKALKLFPYRDTAWIKLIEIVQASAEYRLELLTLASEFYTGDPNQLFLLQAAAAYEQGNLDLAKKFLKTIDVGESLITAPRFFGWPLDLIVIPASAKIQLFVDYINRDLDGFFREHVADSGELEGLFKSGNTVATASQLVQLIDAWRQQDWEKVDIFVSELNSVAVTEDACGFLLSIAFSKLYFSDAKISAQAAKEFLHSIGLSMPITPKKWSKSSDRLKVIRSFYYFRSSEYDKARHEILSANSHKIDVCVPDILSWSFQEPLIKMDSFELSGLVYRSYLAGEIYKYRPLEVRVASMLAKLIDESDIDDDVVEHVFDMIKAISNKDAESLLQLAENLHKNAVSKETSAFTMAIMLDCLSQMDRVEQVKEKSRYAASCGLTLDHLKMSWDCSHFALFFEDDLRHIKDAFSSYVIEKNIELKNEWSKIFEDGDLNSLYRSNAAAALILKRFNDDTDNSGDKLCPEQIYAYWLSSISLGLVTSIGLVYINYSSKEWQWINWLNCEKIDESGFINSYLRIRGGSSKAEIPFDVSGEDRGNIDVALNLVEKFFSIWRCSDSSNVYGVNLEMGEFAEFCHSGLDECHPVLQIHCNDSVFLEASSSFNLNPSSGWKISPMKEVVSGFSTDTKQKIWITPDLDVTKVKEFCLKLPKDVTLHQRDILVYYDDTLFGQGDDGMLITDKFLFYRIIAEDMKMMVLSDIQAVKVKTGFFGSTFEFKTINGSVGFKMSGIQKDAARVLLDILEKYLILRDS